ncbi:MAG: lytic transglycosylase domain-containing protein, partial [Patescibacteria group bacterium]
LPFAIVVFCALSENAFAQAPEGAAIDSIGLLPDAIFFAGARVPIENWTVRERLLGEIRYYTRNQGVRNQIESYFARSAYYLPLMKNRFETAGLHPDYIYLSIVESELMPTARSRAGAVGLWQIMPNTGRECGLRIDGRVDERMSFGRATTCAIRHLERSDSIFRDPLLNLAAFNVGNAGVRRAQLINERLPFWELVFLKRNSRDFNNETERYPYRVIAMKLIMENPRRYFFRGYPIGNLETEVVRYEVPLRRRVTLIGLANELGVDPATFRELNGQFRNNLIPPGMVHFLLVPRRHARP